jgi:hypothetical protein
VFPLIHITLIVNYIVCLSVLILSDAELPLTRISPSLHVAVDTRTSVEDSTNRAKLLALPVICAGPAAVIADPLEVLKVKITNAPNWLH